MTVRISHDRRKSLLTEILTVTFLDSTASERNFNPKELQTGL